MDNGQTVRRTYLMDTFTGVHSRLDEQQAMSGELGASLIYHSLFVYSYAHARARIPARSGTMHHQQTVALINLHTKILDFRGLDSSRFLIF